MSANRDLIIERVRQALNRNDSINDTFAGLVINYDAPIQPALSKDLLDAFTLAAIESAANVYNINNQSDIPTWLLKHAKQHRQQPTLVLSENLTESEELFSEFKVNQRVEGVESWGIVKAFAGIAETGTVVSTSEDCSSSMLFLVERLIVVIDKSDIVAYQEDVWRKLRRRFESNMPRTINLITGPSRTADVEQTIQLGAHGPRWVDYVVTGN